MTNYKYLLLLTLTLNCNIAFPDNRTSSPQVSVMTDADIDSALSFWTPEEIDKAVPFPMPRINQNELEGILSEFEKIDEVVDLPSDDINILGTPSRADVNKSPYNKGGKLYYQINGTNYHCSAQFVGNNSVLLTAAHCLKKANGPKAKNVIFSRADANGKVDVYGIRCFLTPGGWDSTSNIRYKWDYGFIKTSRNSNAGFLAIKTGTPHTNFKSIGYPSNYSNGKYMYQVDGTKGRITNGMVEMKGNPMREGASGGAWLSGNTAIGVNSVYEDGNKTDIWGPYFDSATVNLYMRAKNNCN